MTRIHVAHITAIAISLSIGSAASVSAQSSQDEGSRAHALATARDEKSEDLSAPKRSLVERALYWYDTRGARLGWRDIHFSAGSFPNGAGVGYGIGITRKAIGSAVEDPDQPNRVDGSLFAARSLKGYHRIAARVDFRNITGRPIDIALRWQDSKLPQEDFYGPGNDSDKSRHSNYRLDGSESGLGLSWKPMARVTIGGGLSYLTPSITEGTDPRYATTQSTFTESEAPGLSGLPDFARGDVSLGYDWRDSETHPRRGGHYRTIVAQYRGIDDAAFDFTRVDLSMQQIVPLWSRYRRLELRAAGAFTDTTGGSVPFIFQPSVGGTRTIRGFAESRFRDRNALWASAEYQWEAWWALDAAIFVDAGQVAAHRSDLSLRNFDVTYGIGFRLHGNEHFIARLDLARSREGFTPILGFNYGF